jgi:predicted NUDIX family NTP pyrophosphohydrolase
VRSSAGILVYRTGPDGLEVLLGHMGGPHWARRDARAWTIFKGEYVPGEDPREAALRELEEETGLRADPAEQLMALGEVRQSGGKRVQAWALELDVDAEAVQSNSFEMEWPPRSGRLASFPEIDRAAWFDLDEASGRLVKGQVPLLAILARSLASPAGADGESQR